MKKKTDSQNRMAVLRSRAERLARRRSDDEERALVTHVALFEVGGQLVGVPGNSLREIVPTPRTTPLPGLPATLKGIAQIRGELISVVDLSTVIDSKPSTDCRCLAVLESNMGPIGLLADRTFGFRDIYVDEIATDFEQQDGDAEGRPVLGVTRDLIAVLDVPRLLASDSITVH